MPASSLSTTGASNPRPIIREPSKPSRAHPHSPKSLPQPSPRFHAFFSSRCILPREPEHSGFKALTTAQRGGTLLLTFRKRMELDENWLRIWPARGPAVGARLGVPDAVMYCRGTRLRVPDGVVCPERAATARRTAGAPTFHF
jgi:hypothetical protein